MPPSFYGQFEQAQNARTQVNLMSKNPFTQYPVLSKSWLSTTIIIDIVYLDLRPAIGWVQRRLAQEPVYAIDLGNSKNATMRKRLERL